MAEAIPDKPVSKPKRPKAGELLGNLEMRAALEPFIANDPLGKLGYELFRRGIINVDALVFPSEEHGDYLGRSSGVVQGTFQPSGEYRKAAKEVLESQKSLDTSSKPSLWYSTGRDADLRPGFSDMNTLSHELRHAAINYLENKGLYELPKEVDGAKLVNFEEALVTSQDIKRIKNKDYYTKDLDASKSRQPKEEFTSLLNSIYSEVSDVAQKELTNLNVPKEAKQKEKGWISKAKDFLGLDKGGIPMQRQMEMFQDGGLEQDGNTVDPISGNDVPVGSAQEEVRDDIPAQLSEGEFVFPADVVRYIGLEKLMMIRQKAKAGLKRMEEMGQMGNSEEATIPDDIPFDVNDLEIIDDSIPAYRGGAIQSFANGGSPYAEGVTVQPGSVVQGQNFGASPNDLTIVGPPWGDNPIIPILPVEPRPTSPVQDDGGYKPPTVADTPVQSPVNPTPPFNVFVPPVADSYKEWVNDEGIVINVPYFRGNILPGYTVPEGYRLKETESTAPEQEGILSDVTQQPERDREREIQIAEKDKKDRERSYDNVIKQVMQDNPGASLDELIKKIKGGEATAFTHPLTGKIVKAPGFLFDEDNITSAYNRALLKDEDDYESGEGMEDTALTGTAAQEAIDKAAERIKAKEVAEQRKLYAEAQAATKKAEKAAQAAQEARNVAEAEKARKELENQRKASQETEAYQAAARKAELDRINRQKEKDANEEQRIKDREEARKAAEEGRADRDFQRDASGRKNYERGGIAAKPKPKKKKTMKRGGIASKK